MNKLIRHRRLYAFYQSKVLNALMVLLICSLFLMYYTGMMLLPILCGTLALLFFIGYSLWLWIWKPARVVINGFLSDYTGYLILYFLIVGAIKTPNQWLSIFPVVISVVMFFIVMVKNFDCIFDIVQMGEDQKEKENVLTE